MSTHKDEDIGIFHFSPIIEHLSPMTPEKGTPVKHWAKLLQLCCICGDHIPQNTTRQLCDSYRCHRTWIEDKYKFQGDSVEPLQTITEDEEEIEIVHKQTNEPILINPPKKERRYNFRNHRPRYDYYSGSFFNPVDVTDAHDDEELGTKLNPINID